MKRPLSWLLGAALGALPPLALQHAGAEEALRVPFLCTGSGAPQRVTALFFRAEPSTLVLLVGNRALRLPQVIAASGARYSDGATTFWNKGDQAEWTATGRSPIRCRATR